MTIPVSSQWLHCITPISDDQPCGQNIEYTPDYMTLISALLPQEEVQYGDFIDIPEGPNWSDIDRQCQVLLTRTKDIHLLAIWLRARTRLAGIHGLQEGFAVLVHLLQHYPDTIHPLATIDGEFDLSMRANALSQLADPEGLLGDIRDMSFSRATRSLSLRDVERTFSVPQLEGALPTESVRQQIIDLYHNNDKDIHALLNIAQHIQQVETWAIQHLPDMSVNLHKLKVPFQIIVNIISQIPPATMPESEQVNLTASHTTSSIPMSLPILSKPTIALTSRQQATQSLQTIRIWFEENEPSSPVSVLLWQAEKMIGKRFYEVAQCIPLDVLARWENEIKQTSN